MRGRVAIAALTSALVAVAVAASCGFPDPVLLQLDGSTSGTSSGSSGGASDAADDGSVPVQDAGSDAMDAAPKPCDSGKPCDCDGDGFLSAACDGSDCDDYDSRRKPDAGFRDDVPAAGTNGDWNCDTIVTPEFRTNTYCDGLVPCTGSVFTNDPGCGRLTPGTFNTCGDIGGGVCGATNVTGRVLKCK